MDMQHLDTILIVMVAIFGVSVLLHIGVLAGLAIGMSKAVKQAREYGQEMEEKVLPVLASTAEVLQQTKSLIVRLEPKLEAAATDLSDITRMAREETSRLTTSADEIAERFRQQAERVAQMTDTALNGVERASHFLNSAVNAPARQASGILAAAKAVISSLRQPTSPRPSQPTDEDYQRERQQYV
ncbi:hypothetical protein [Occallatibacter riparius]|uniref:DUF948 domain-containing protein n=1 Tax=Occallatibacter riparius TaxID=1002689 RepID=A0A9J7BUM6_9BACT|nr:hypothetical protein [Occallatibacter riparius]UWZ86580.1 hypothetical protein MOP44_11690 [Occallatibacter riparius]